MREMRRSSCPSAWLDVKHALRMGRCLPQGGNANRKGRVFRVALPSRPDAVGNLHEQLLATLDSGAIIGNQRQPE